MIRHVFAVPQHRWAFRVYIATDCGWAPEILGHLERLGAPAWIRERAAANMACGLVNTGLTYASPEARETLMVVGRTTSAAELFNSVVHELDHATLFTFPLVGITPDTEQAAYFKGGLARELFPLIQPYLCEHCRHNFTK